MMKQQQTATGRKGRNALLAASVFFLVGIIFWGGFNTAMEATNTLDFCISCHEMESTVYQEYRHSVHYLNASGVQATCPDCHVPREWTAKVVRKIKASRELYYWLTGEIDTHEKFEAKRLELATRVWETMQDSGSQECRNCHQFSVMDLQGQARFAARSHADALEDGKTCIDCHKGIAHHMPEPAVTVTESDIDLDMELGEEINATCAGCHGEYGEGSIDGEYPRLAGLSVEYLARQLRHFKQRERLNIPMVPFTTERELPEEDLLAVAAYLSSIQLPTRLPPVEEAEFNALERLRASKRVVNIAPYSGNVAAGQKLYHDECASCHGRDAYGDTGHLVPPLAGQHSLYLFRQVEKFRSGERLHDDPRDAGIFRLFSDSEIDAILAYLATLDDV